MAELSKALGHCIALFFHISVTQHGPCQHCNTPHIKRVQLEQRNSWFDPSFFWGYLLTQILGGIWVDKIGGKLVLGFEVVW